MERTNERTNEWMNERMIKWMSEWIIEWLDERMTERTNERMNNRGKQTKTEGKWNFVCNLGCLLGTSMTVIQVQVHPRFPFLLFQILMSVRVIPVRVQLYPVSVQKSILHRFDFSHVNTPLTWYLILNKRNCPNTLPLKPGEECLKCHKACFLWYEVLQSLRPWKKKSFQSKNRN